jgi:hypothetical protein
MPIRCTWDDQDNSIIWFVVEGHWTWEEYHREVDTSIEMMKTVNHRVDLLADMREAGPVPLSAASLHAKSSFSRLPSNHGLSVIIGADSFAQTLIKLVQSVMPVVARKSRTARSVEEVLEIIAEHREVVSSN